MQAAPLMFSPASVIDTIFFFFHVLADGPAAVQHTPASQLLSHDARVIAPCAAPHTPCSPRWRSYTQFWCVISGRAAVVGDGSPHSPHHHWLVPVSHALRAANSTCVATGSGRGNAVTCHRRQRGAGGAPAGARWRPQLPCLCLRPSSCWARPLCSREGVRCHCRALAARCTIRCSRELRTLTQEERSSSSSHTSQTRNPPPRIRSRSSNRWLKPGQSSKSSMLHPWQRRSSSRSSNTSHNQNWQRKCGSSKSSNQQQRQQAHPVSAARCAAWAG